MKEKKEKEVILTDLIRDDIQRNRSLFNRDYVALFDVARSIAYIVALLEETVLAVVQSMFNIN